MADTGTMAEKLGKVTFRIAIVWGIMFSLQSLGTCIMVGLTNVNWVEMKAQAKFILIVGIFVNWSGTLMAYLSKTVARLEAGKEPPVNGSAGPSDTTFLTKGPVGPIVQGGQPATGKMG